MASTLTLRVGEQLPIYAAAKVDSRPSGEAFTYETSDATTVALVEGFEDRVIAMGVRTGTAIVTASIAGTSDTCTVTVIAAGDVVTVSLSP